MNLAEVERLAAAGERETIEFKRSTVELGRTGETNRTGIGGPT